MIRLCDKEIYVINELSMSRSECLSFFLNGHIEDIIVLVAEDGQFEAALTYKSLLAVDRIEEALSCYSVTASNVFTDETRNYFKEYPNSMIPVLNENKDILGFACNQLCDLELEETNKFCEFFSEARKYMEAVCPEIKQFCIYDINECAWNLYITLKNNNFPVCVIGEKWEWFGIKSLEGIYDYPDFAVARIYAEGCCSIYKNISQRHEIDISAIFNVHERLFGYIYPKIKQRILKKTDAIIEIVFPKAEDISHITELEYQCKLINSKWDMGNIFKKKYMDQIFGSVAEKFYMGTINRSIRLWWNEGNQSLYSYSEIDRRRKRVYIIGPCTIIAPQTEEKESLCWYLSEFFEKKGYQLVGVDAFPNINITTLHEDLRIKKGDIILFFDQLGLTDLNLKTIKLIELFNDKTRESYMTEDSSLHLNYRGHKAVADYLIQRLPEYINEFSQHEDNSYVQMGQAISYEDIEKINQYIDKYHLKNGGGQNGAIVMNCNPFTLGHQYLIETAAAIVDTLYVFVVQEDKSEFSFEDRYKLVKEGTAHLNNVVVAPSGDYMISSKTFTAYFSKAEIQNREISATEDIEIFARYIAPPLNIKIRFAGEEPYDNVTRQYNEQMSEILGEFGIEFYECKRKQENGEPISASKVRELLKQKNWDELKKYVPENTYQYLMTL